MSKPLSDVPCPHEKIEYSLEHDNYYCTKCRCGMGSHYYALAERLNEMAVELKAARETLGKLPLSADGFRWYADDMFAVCGHSVSIIDHRIFWCDVCNKSFTVEECYATRAAALAARQAVDAEGKGAGNG